MNESFKCEDKYGNRLHVERTFVEHDSDEKAMYFYVCDDEGSVGVDVPDDEIWDLINFLIKVAP